MNNKPKIIFYIGVIGSGKTYQARQKEKEGYIHINFADSVKDFVWGMINWKPGPLSVYEIEYETFKECNFNSLTEHDEVSFTGRNLLEGVGENCKRFFGKDCWIDIFIDKLWEEINCRGNTKFVCSDLRFYNEFEKIYNLIFDDWSILEIEFIFCNYHSDRYDDKRNHISEKMAQYFLTLGYKDGDSIDIGDFYEFGKMI